MWISVILFVGIFILLYAFAYFKAYRIVRQIIFVNPIVKTLPKPKGYWDAIAEIPRDELASLGFEYRGNFQQIEFLKSLNLNTIKEAWFNPQTGAWLVFALAADPESIWPWRVFLFNYNTAGEYKICFNDPSEIIDESNRSTTIALYDWGDLINYYHQWLDEANFSEINKSGDFNEFLTVFKVIVKTDFNKWIIEKKVLPTSESKYLLSKSFVINLLKNLGKFQKAKKVALNAYKSKVSDVILPNELWYRIIESHNSRMQVRKGNPLSKWIIFGVTGVLFAIGMGWLTDFSYLISILVVLLIHELGHAAFMKLFGYKDLSIFFIPFLGAAASGKKSHDLKPWQEAVVLLGGPIPGIIFCSIVMLFFSDLLEIDWVFSLVVVGIVLNLFNLLPFNPLDGGRLFDLLFTRRFPKLGSIFAIFSALAIGGIGFALEESFLITLGVILLLGLKGELSRRKILQKIYQDKKSTVVTEVELQKQIVDELPYGDSFQNKVNTYNTLKPLLYSKMANFKTIIAIGIIYFFGILIPILPGLALFGGINDLSGLTSMMPTFYTSQDIPLKYKDWADNTCKDSSVYSLSVLEQNKVITFYVGAMNKEDSLRISKTFGFSDGTQLFINAPIYYPGSLDHDLRDSLWTSPSYAINDESAYEENNLDALDDEDTFDSLYELNQQKQTIISLREDSIWSSWPEDEKMQWIVQNRPDVIYMKDSCSWYTNPFDEINADSIDQEF